MVEKSFPFNPHGNQQPYRGGEGRSFRREDGKKPYFLEEQRVEKKSKRMEYSVYNGDNDEINGDNGEINGDNDEINGDNDEINGDNDEINGDNDEILIFEE
ncbi:hypothetical protein NPIL_568991 [Nephila pilipes]|uniref:Uncharacterized protein n=1 Tax=Nephila pilipes TaxID=299642 RepID=A0A8X6Q2Z4_NEPPI|nr:hypothetical protein NPIL_568991 [Nephila pilipes]